MAPCWGLSPGRGTRGLLALPGGSSISLSRCRPGAPCPRGSHGCFLPPGSICCSRLDHRPRCSGAEGPCLCGCLLSAHGCSLPAVWWRAARGSPVSGGAGGVAGAAVPRVPRCWPGSRGMPGGFGTAPWR